MRRIRRTSLVVLALASALAGLHAGGAAAAPETCVIQLRVNVFGTTSPESHWALGGGLNAGQLATVRAVARGCRIDHIRGRWISGGSGAIPTRQCGGTATCTLRVRSGRQSAAAFQAFATPSGGARSNVVRVGWAGTCTAVGTRRHQTDDIGSTTWEIQRGGAAQETGIGNATGTATLTGHVLRITFVASDQVTTGSYSWTLNANCQKGSGTLEFTGPPSRVGERHPSTVVRAGAG